MNKHISCISQIHDMLSWDRIIVYKKYAFYKQSGMLEAGHSDMSIDVVWSLTVSIIVYPRCILHLAPLK